MQQEVRLDWFPTDAEPILEDDIDPRTIKRSPVCQPRVNGTDPDLVADYAAEMRSYDERYNGEGWRGFPYIKCVNLKQGTLVLYDGFHRLGAIIKNRYPVISIYSLKGKRYDAIMLSKGENLKHGMRASNADKKRNVLICLTDGELRTWTDRQIAEWCGVSPQTVTNHSTALSKMDSEKYKRPNIRKYITKHGTVATMDVSRINKRSDDEFSYAKDFVVKDYYAEKLYREQVGKRFAKIRKHLKLSQAEVAKKLNITRQHVCQIERGTHNISPMLIHDFCNVYGVVSDWLLGLPTKEE